MIETRRYCLEGLPFPIVYEPADAPGVRAERDVLELLRERRGALLGELQRYGAILLRGFAVEGPAAFQEVVRVFAPTLMSYEGGDSPRAAVTDKVYTSTSYPASAPISLHNEMSYSREYPSLIAFYCEIPPEVGGATPLADCRQVLRALTPELVERFRTKRLRYVQNLHAGVGLGKSWRDTFETDDRAKVEAILARRGAELQWKPDGSLRVAEVIDPIVTHPSSGEPVFFSQAHLWHVSSLDPRTRDALRKIVKEEDLYHACSFGDGSPISEEDLGEIRRALDAATIEFPWRKRDVLLLDNLLIAHGRRPFQGPRRVLVAMGGRGEHR
jgi:alpha-ketoglutarate-dependent taurine dioxygenase